MEPKLIWEQFDDITRVPRPSKKEEKIIAWLQEFAAKHGFEHETDATGNVVIRKAATAGYENRPAVILQSHMDMVCEKRSDVEFDFENDPSAPSSRMAGYMLRVQRLVLTAASVWLQPWLCCSTRHWSTPQLRHSLL